MHLRLALKLLHFLPDLGELYALRFAPNFYEIHPWRVVARFLKVKTLFMGLPNHVLSLLPQV
jgi:hypothetical protein